MYNAEQIQKNFTLVFVNEKMMFASPAALNLYNSYLELLVNKDITEFMDQESINKLLSLYSKGNLVHDAKLNLLTGHTIECEVLIKNFNDSFRQMFIFGKNLNKKGIAEWEEASVAFPNGRFYDPLQIGANEIVKNILNNEITNIYYSIDMLKKLPEFELDHEFKKVVSDLEFSSNILYCGNNRYLEEYSALMNDFTMRRSVVNFTELLNIIIKDLQRYIKIESVNAKIMFSTREKDCYIIADEDKITEAIASLIAFTIKFSAVAGKMAFINIKLLKEKDDILLVIEDNNKILNDEVIEVLSKQDVQLNSLSSNSDIDLSKGLKSINKIITSNDGELRFSCNEHIGTRYYLRLPACNDVYSFKQTDGQKIIPRINAILSKIL